MDPHDSRYEEWSVEDHEGDPEFVGVLGNFGGPVPVYYADQEESFFGAEVDEENETLRRSSEHEWDHDPADTLGDAIEGLGDELGWESLSEFAGEHLEDEEN